MSLPGWVVDNASSVREEAPYVSLSAAERARMLAAACCAGTRLLRACADAARILEYVDPLPESSEHALARLRALKRAVDAGAG